MVSRNIRSWIIPFTVLAVAVVFILWWFFGWHYALEPVAGTSMEALA